MTVRIIPESLSADPVAVDRFNRSVLSVSLSDEVGQVAEVLVQVGLWDEVNGGWREDLVEALYPGESAEVWDGKECHGSFTFETQERNYSQDETTFTAWGYGGLRALVKEEQSRVYQGYTNDSDWIPLLLDEHGMGVDLKSSEFQSFKGDRFKELGESDLNFLNTIAMANGLGLPYVRYDPQAQKETVVLRALDPEANRGLGALKLRVTSETGESDFTEFGTLWDAGDMPTAVEVIGWDKAVRKPYRVTVQATPKGPKLLSKEYTDIGRAERKKVAPGRRGGDSRGVVVHLLGDGREAVDTNVVYRVKTGKRRRRIRAKKQYREILATTFAEGVDDAVKFAKRWLQTRMEAYYTCDGVLVPNLPGTEGFRVNQAHRVVGAAQDDNGWYIVTSVNHEWGADGHAVTFDGSRLLLDVIAPLRGQISKRLSKSA